MNNYRLYASLEKLDLESKCQSIEQIPDLEDDDLLFTTQWIVTIHIYAIGISKKTNKLVKLKTSIKPYLYVWTSDFDMLNILHNLSYLDLSRQIELSEEIKEINNITILDALLINNRKKNYNLYKIPTISHKASMQLHALINNSIEISFYLSVIGVWSLEIFVLLELYLKSSNLQSIYSIYINNNLEIIDVLSFQDIFIDVISLDIETISHEDHRIPTGENKSDIINSVSIIKYSTKNKECHKINIFNLPISNDEIQNAKKLINNEYTKEREIKIVTTEEELLQMIFNILDMMNTTLYYMLGYNSKAYDMPYLLNRAIYLNMPQMNNFLYNNGILIYGVNMIHIDMFQIISKYYANELLSFSLKNVAKTLLNNITKIDMNARLLRYIYKHIMDTGLGDGTFPRWNITLSQMMEYNEIDSMIVLELWNNLQYEKFLLFIANDYLIPLIRIGQTGVSEYLNNKIIIEGLKLNYICTSHHSKQFSFNKSILLSLNLDKLVANNNNENVKYGGGFNFRDSKEHIKSVVAMDAQMYYPEIIAGFNLSHETTTILDISTIKHLIDLDKQTIDILKQCKLFRFCTHKNKIPIQNNEDADLLDNMSGKFYLFGLHDNASEINIDFLHLYKNDELILIINMQVDGLLSKILKHRNMIRCIAKISKKDIQQTIQICDNYLEHLELTGDNEEEELSDFDFDNLDSDDMLNTNEKIEFDLEKYKIQKDLNLSNEIFMIKPHYILLQKNDFKKFKNKKEVITKYRNVLWMDYININGSYRNMKLVNSSIYGLLGSSYGILKGIVIAAASTMIGRKYIIESAKCSQQINCKTVYSDTDSIFISIEKSSQKNPIEYITKYINSINSCLVLNTKIYRNIFIMAKKKYIAQGNNIFSKGINKNGPELWNLILFNVYETYICKNTKIYQSDLLELLENIYIKTFNILKEDKSKILCTMSIKNVGDYKTKTPVKKLLDSLLEESPHIIFNRKITYFHKLVNTPQNVVFEIDYKLENTPLSRLNLFKFYSNIIKTIYDIISYAITRTNIERNVYTKISFVEFQKINILAFSNIVNSI
uniref:DNA polymerase n=1 Tax=Faxonius propinquus nudivirus TaxID=3139431 RepID=A0AAU8GBU8_9VIRU